MEKMKWIVTLEGDLEKVPVNVHGPYETNRGNTIKPKLGQAKGIGVKGNGIKHGTIGGYKYYKCRCQECRVSARIYQKQFVESQEMRDRRNARKREKTRQERLDREFNERQKASGE